MSDHTRIDRSPNGVPHAVVNGSCVSCGDIARHDEWGMATGKQLTKIVLQLQDLGVASRARRISVVQALSGRPSLTSTRDLTTGQASLLIEELVHILSSADPAAELAAACARAESNE